MKRLENDKFQDLVLNHLAKLTQDITEFKQETGERFDKIEQNMATKDDLNHALAEGQKDILSMLQHIDKKLDTQTEQMDAKFEVLNNRLFNQETQLRLLKK
jgi:hypothetical protein